MKNIRGKIIIEICMMLILIFGVGAVAYPFVGNTVMSYLDQQIIDKAQAKANREDKQNIAAYQKKMQAENARLALEGINAGSDPFSETEEEVDFAKNPDYLEEHTIGSISIPQIDVRLPIFDRTSDFFLQRGASLLEGTSYPIGGASTHSVISAHRGLSNAKFFTDLPELVAGDLFYIEIGGNTFAYKVVKTQVVAPQDTDQLQIEPGKDLVTLLTCTPYMVNSHRLLVTGERTTLPKEAQQALTALKEKQRNLLYLVGACSAVVVGGIGYFFWRRIKQKIIRERRYNVIINDVKKGPYQLLHKKNNKPFLVNGQPVVLVPDSENSLMYQNLRGGKYILKGQQDQYRLWIEKINQKKFSYKNK